MKPNVPRLITLLIRASVLRSLAAFGIPFLIYLLTLAPSIYNLDSAELTVAAATLGITRSTGYPLYTLVGHFWSLLPVGDVGYRINLFSAFTGSLTVLLADLSLRRLKVGPWASFVALALLAFSPFFWGLSIVAEVYTLHTALMAALTLLLIEWDQHPSVGRFGWVMFCLGLGLDHHLATVLLIPGVVWFLLSKKSPKLWQVRNLLVGIACLTAALSVYAYLPIRYLASPPFNYAGSFTAAGQFQPLDLTQFKNLFGLITGINFRVLMFQYSWTEIPAESIRMLSFLWSAFAGIGIGPGLYGLYCLLRINARFGIMSLLMFLGNFLFYLGYAVIDKQTMLLPIYLVFAFWVGIGLQSLLDWVSRPAKEDTYTLRRLRFDWHKVGMQGLLLLVTLGVVGWNYPRVNLSRDHSTRDLAVAVLAEAKPNAIIIGLWDTIPAIQYLQLVEGQRPDVMGVNRFLMDPAVLGQFIQNQVGKRPVYIDRLPSDFAEEYQVEASEPMYTIHPK